MYLKLWGFTIISLLPHQSYFCSQYICGIGWVLLQIIESNQRREGAALRVPVCNMQKEKCIMRGFHLGSTKGHRQPTVNHDILKIIDNFLTKATVTNMEKVFCTSVMDKSKSHCTGSCSLPRDQRLLGYIHHRQKVILTKTPEIIAIKLEAIMRSHPSPSPSLCPTSGSILPKQTVADVCLICS